MVSKVDFFNSPRCTTDILKEICSYLDDQSLLRTATTCGALYTFIVNDTRGWRIRAERNQEVRLGAVSMLVHVDPTLLTPIFEQYRARPHAQYAVLRRTTLVSAVGLPILCALWWQLHSYLKAGLQAEAAQICLEDRSDQWAPMFVITAIPALLGFSGVMYLGGARMLYHDLMESRLARYGGAAISRIKDAIPLCRKKIKKI